MNEFKSQSKDFIDLHGHNAFTFYLGHADEHNQEVLNFLFPDRSCDIINNEGDNAYLVALKNQKTTAVTLDSLVEKFQID